VRAGCMPGNIMSLLQTTVSAGIQGRLLRTFSITSAVTITAVVIMVGLVFWNMGLRNLELSVEQLAKILLSESNYSGKSLNLKQQVALSADQDAKIVLMGVSKIDLDGRRQSQDGVVWPQTSALSGIAYQQARFGKTGFAMYDLSEQGGTSGLLAVVLPQRSRSAAAPDYIVAMYFDISKAEKDVYAQVLNAVLITAMLLIIAWGIAYAVVHRGDVLIGQQQRLLYKTEKNLNTVLYQDSLTGLPNRTMFLQHLEHAMTRVRRHGGHLALMTIDIDGLHYINANIGPDAGDQVLVELVQRLGLCIRETDMLVRMGGDEFAVIMEDLDDAAESAYLAERIRAVNRRVFEIDGHDIDISLSIGISVYPEDGTEADSLRRNADIARYRVKDKGGNHYLYYAPEMNVRCKKRFTNNKALRNALRREEFRLHYQPKVMASTGELTGMEALIRWQHPERGLLPPGDFLPGLEESGLIVEVGTWVMRKACETNRCWQQQGLPGLPVSVNVDSQQFQQDDFVEKVAGILAETRLDPKYLQIEVVEGTVIEDTEKAINKMHDLRKLGISLAIDDFGTGYSSLGYLKKFPIDTLKIDRSFVSRLSDDSDSAAIVTAFMGIVHTMKLDAVAEGVETLQELKFLNALGCHIIQGFFFSKPLSEQEFEILQKDTQRLQQRLLDAQTASEVASI